MFSILTASILLAATCVGCGTDSSSSSSTAATTKTSATSEVTTDSTTTVDSNTTVDITESSSENTSTDDIPVAHNEESTSADAINLTDEEKLAEVE